MKKIDYSKVIENASEREFYEKTCKKIIDYVALYQPVTFWNIVRNVQGSDRRVLRLVNQLVIAGIFSRRNNIICLSNFNKHNKVQFSVCDSCNGKLISLSGEILNILNIMRKIVKDKPIPTFFFDQRPVTTSTSVRRAAYLFWRGDLEGKNIVVIGDDDLTSLAIGLFGKAKSVVVFDIDARLISFINNVSKKMNLNVKAYCKDLTKGIPKKFMKRFDVFLADPTPSPKPFELFTSVGLALLKPGEENVGYLSFFPSHQQISVDFQKILTKREVIITDMIPKFTEYDFLPTTYGESDLNILRDFDSNEEKLSFYENLVRFETTLKTCRDISKINLKQTLGKATKRVMLHPEKDPAFNSKDHNFIIKLVNKMRKL